MSAKELVEEPPLLNMQLGYIWTMASPFPLVVTYMLLENPEISPVFFSSCQGSLALYNSGQRTEHIDGTFTKDIDSLLSELNEGLAAG